MNFIAVSNKNLHPSIIMTFPIHNEMRIRPHLDPYYYVGVVNSAHYRNIFVLRSILMD